jgi:membrane associated rhomboid family serine protease
MYQEYRPSKFQILPPVVKNLLIINGIMFLASKVLYLKFDIDLSDTLGLHYPLSERFNTFQLISHLFMHGSFGHIFLNMLVLWMFGNVLENLWGSKRFLIFYFVTGLGAAAVHLLFMSFEVMNMREAIELYATSPNIVDFKTLISKYEQYGYASAEMINRVYSEFHAHPGSGAIQQESVDAAWQLLKNKMDVATVGASGAVYGVLLAFGMLFPNTLIYLYFFIPVKAKYVVILAGFMELYLGFENSADDNVAHFAHLGGMLFGFILLKFWNKHNRNRFY